MSLITDTWQQLVRRRLWPVALGLLAALAAMPLLLAREPEVQPVAATSPSTVAGEEMTEPVVALDDEGADHGRRRVLGARKDPFAPAPAAKRKRSAKAASGTATPSSAQAASSSGGGSGGGGPSGGGSVAATPVTSSTPASAAEPKPTAKKKSKALPRYSATVRFDGKRRSLEPREAAPSAANPAVVYLGVSGDGKRAVFLLDAGTTTEGDGTCDPSPQNCETIELSPGETEFITVTGEDGESEEHQLDVVRIHKGAASAAKASKAVKAGRSSLRAHVSADGPLRYRLDGRTGTARKLSRRAFKAAASAAARAAAARAS